jgi:hypothetical protein
MQITDGRIETEGKSQVTDRKIETEGQNVSN